MQTSNPKDLVDLLQKKTLRIRTGMWIIPVSMLGTELDQAARLDIDAIDIRTPLLESLPEGTRYLGLNVDRILQLLQEVSDQLPGSECLLVYNLDLLLAKLPYKDIAYIWKHLYDSFPNRRHALLISMPETANHLMPEVTSLRLWNNDKRLSSTNSKEI
jgi:hypothetical protein